jgi:rRNA maturation protein Nop10
MEEMVKVCPACGAEYVPQIERCADCGETLVLPGPPGAAAPPPPASPAADPARGLVCVRTADLGWARRLGARLERSGIDHLLEAEETAGARCCGAGRFRVLVRTADAEAASRLDAEQYREDVPDLQAPLDHDLNPETCPACGGPAPESAAECPSCGLALVLELEGCPGCGAPLPPGVKRCPGCGRDAGQRCC